jgi:membrane protease YdiL (CAAX protease family)
MKTDFSKAVVSNGHAESRPIRGLFLGFILMDLFMLLLPDFVPGLRIPGSHWNWPGKVLSIAFCCLVLAYSPWLRQNVGLRWQQAKGSLPFSVICLLACLVYSIVLGFTDGPGSFSLETLLFQTFMPSIDEELAFRGIGLALLERGYGQSPMNCRFRYGMAAFSASIAFGLVHAIQYRSHLGFTFEYVPFIRTFVTGSIFALVRTRSGSLLWPMLCHTAINVPTHLVAMMG